MPSLNQFAGPTCDCPALEYEAEFSVSCDHEQSSRATTSPERGCLKYSTPDWQSEQLLSQVTRPVGRP